MLISEVRYVRIHYVRPVRRIGTEIRSGPVRSSVSDRSRTDLGPDRFNKIFSDGVKFSKKKFGATRSISSKNRRNRSHPRDFWAVWSLENSRAIFWRIRPIVPGFRRLWLQFDQIPGRSAEFTKKWHMDFSSCHVMIWWYDEMMVWWYDDMMVWRYDDMIVWWYVDTVSYTHLTLPTKA